MHHKWAIALAMALSIGAACASCSGGDDAIGLVTTTAAVSTTSAAPSTTVAPTTTAPVPTTSTSTAAPTTPAPPTTTVDDLKAQIAADYVASKQKLREIQFSPSLVDLDSRMERAAAAGSPYFAQQVAYIRELVSVGDVVKPSEPAVDTVVVENVILEGAAPYVAASLLVCEADNLRRVTPAENSPVGEEIFVVGGELSASRFTVHVSATVNGWLRDSTIPPLVDGLYRGQATCDPA